MRGDVLGQRGPLDALLAAAKRLEQAPRFHFMFIGGGFVKRQIAEMVRRESPSNISCMPYQPLKRVRYSLSAVDIHMVSIGDASVGIIHPCKMYGTMALVKPVLALGPGASDLGGIVHESGAGWIHPHGNAEGVVATLERFVLMPPGDRDAVAVRAEAFLRARYSPAALLGQLVDVLEAGTSEGQP